MDTSLYIQKAVLQFSRGQNAEAVISLQQALETANDNLMAMAQAHCIWGEFLFTQEQYDEAKKHLLWIIEKQNVLEMEYDDLLAEEIRQANMLLDMMA